MKYRTIGDTEGFADFLKEVYRAKQGKVTELRLPAIKYLAISGTGSPQMEGGPFQDAIGALYTVAYTLKMGLKFEKIAQPKGWFDYRVATFSGQWWTEGAKEFNIKKASWKLLIPVPPFVTARLVETAKRQAAAKQADAPAAKVQLETIREGNVAQTLHIGPYDQEDAAIELVLSHIESKGREVAGPHHEVYLSDPARVPESKWKTVIRYPYK
jgi:hypothetical protein